MTDLGSEMLGPVTFETKHHPATLASRDKEAESVLTLSAYLSRPAAVAHVYVHACHLGRPGWHVHACHLGRPDPCLLRCRAVPSRPNRERAGEADRQRWPSSAGRFGWKRQPARAVVRRNLTCPPAAVATREVEAGLLTQSLSSSPRSSPGSPRMTGWVREALDAF